MATFLGIVLRYADNIWQNLRLFSFRNRTILEIIFILFYALVQIVLIMLAWYYPKHISLFVSLFAIIILTLFSLHKLVMESRIKILEQQVMDLTFDKEKITEDIAEMYNRYYELLDKKTTKNKKA